MLPNIETCLCDGICKYGIEEEHIMTTDNPFTIEYVFDFSDCDATMMDRVIQNGPATIVFWEDGTKTVVKRSKNDPESDIYSVVAYALAKKLYGSNSQFKKLVDECLEVKDSHD